MIALTSDTHPFNEAESWTAHDLRHDINDIVIFKRHDISAMPGSATDVTIPWSLCLPHSRSLLKPLDRITRHIAGTLVWPQVTLYWIRPPR